MNEIVKGLSGTESTTVEFDEDIGIIGYVKIINRNNADLMIIVNGITTKITPEDRVFEGRFHRIRAIEIVATGEWELKVGI